MAPSLPLNEEENFRNGPLDSKEARGWGALTDDLLPPPGRMPAYLPTAGGTRPQDGPGQQRAAADHLGQMGACRLSPAPGRRVPEGNRY